MSIQQRYAGLTSFAQLEPEIAKLDMSLIRDVNHSKTKQKLNVPALRHMWFWTRTLCVLALGCVTVHLPAAGKIARKYSSWRGAGR